MIFFLKKLGKTSKEYSKMSAIQVTYSKRITHVVYNQESCFLYHSHLPLTALYDYHGAIQLGTVSKHDMNIVLLLDASQVWRISIRERLQCSYYWQFKAEDQWSQFL